MVEGALVGILAGWWLGRALGIALRPEGVRCGPCEVTPATRGEVARGEVAPATKLQAVRCGVCDGSGGIYWEWRWMDCHCCHGTGRHGPTTVGCGVLR